MSLPKFASLIRSQSLYQHSILTGTSLGNRTACLPRVAAEIRRRNCDGDFAEAKATCVVVSKTGGSSLGGQVFELANMCV